MRNFIHPLIFIDVLKLFLSSIFSQKLLAKSAKNKLEKLAFQQQYHFKSHKQCFGPGSVSFRPPGSGSVACRIRIAKIKPKSMEIYAKINQNHIQKEKKIHFCYRTQMISKYQYVLSFKKML